MAIRRLKTRILGAAVFLWPFFASAVSAQGLITDRPDFTESGVVVPTGSLQLEAGLSIADLAVAGPIDETEWTFGEALLRWGAGSRLEARVEVPNYHRLSHENELLTGSQGQESVSGFGDPAIGAKYQIGPFGDSGGIDMALIGMVSIPVGDDEFGSDEAVPEGILTISRDLGSGLSLGGQVFGSLPPGADGRSFIWGVTVVTAASVGPVGIFAEFAADVPEDGTAPMVAHGGVAVPLSERFQLDLHAGFGLSETAPDAFAGAGFAAGF